MMVTSTLLISSGAAVGTLSRYGIGQMTARLRTGQFPWITWFVNLGGTCLGSLLLRLLTASHGGLYWQALLCTGFCGGFTTFATMSAEARQLLRHKPILAYLYLASSIGLGVLLSYLVRWT